MGLTDEVCRAIVAGEAAIGADVLERAKTVMLDGFAVAVAGSREAAPKILAAHFREAGGRPAAAMFGFGERTSVTQAAYVNGVSMHVLDFEPMWHPPTHPTSVTLPAVAALAESLGAGGRAAVVALIKGFEIQSRLLLAAHQYSAQHLDFHPPGVVGPIGAAVAAAHLLELDVPALRNAIGIAASRAGGLLANVGTMTKSTHCGLASALGLEAALLAKRGFTGNLDVLEPFFEAFFERLDPRPLAAFGRPYRLVDPGVAIKRYPSQYGTHFAISAGRELHPQLDGVAIDSIELRIPDLPYVDRPQPATGLDGKFSLQYAFATALLDGDVGIDTFTDERRRRSDVEAVLAKIRTVRDPEISTEFPTMSVEASVTLRDATVRRARCDGPLGLWKKPPLPPEEHDRKIRDCLSRRLDGPRIDEFVQLVRGFDALSAKEVKRCWELLC